MLKHIYHYNTNAEQAFFFGGQRSLYDLIALNGNIVSHTPAGVAGFIANTAKPFYIDPQTHAFQHATSNLKRDVRDKDAGGPPQMEFKPSIRKLADRLGTPFREVIESDRPISPDVFYEGGQISTPKIREICESALNFEQTVLRDSLDDDTREFLEGGESFLPDFVVPPYFYLAPNRLMDWLTINMAAYTETRAIHQNSRVFLPILVSKSSLQENSPAVLEAVESLKPDGILLWIDDHEEESLTSGQILGFAKVVESLRSNSGDVFNTHGGYLSVLFGHDGCGSRLTGVGHSINYGESRSIIPVGGGIPLAHFYFPSIHSRLRFGDALEVARANGFLGSPESYRENVCQCAECARLLVDHNMSVDEAFYAYGENVPTRVKRRSGAVVSLSYPTKEAKCAAARHYLNNKSKEFEDASDRQLRDLITDLGNTFDMLSVRSGEELVSHLSIWQSALNEILS